MNLKNKKIRVVFLGDSKYLPKKSYISRKGWENITDYYSDI
jgi:hypothetical protein